MIRFLHAADLHLDSPLRGLERYEGAPVEEIRGASRRALANLVELAISEKVDFVVLAGDIYDGDWRDVGTGLYFIDQTRRLREAGVRVFVLAGNHDAANAMTRTLPYPDNVQIFPHVHPDSFVLDDVGVALHGQSFADRAEPNNLALRYPAAVRGMVNIGVLHTALTGREGHERYAPCMIEDLLTRNYDYWALGHVHQRESVRGDEHPRVEFPGNAQGRTIREPGAKGCLLASVNGRGVTAEFRELDVLRWERIRVPCDDFACHDDLLAAVTTKLEDVHAGAGGRLLAVRVELTGACRFHDALAARASRLRDEIRALALPVGGGSIWIERLHVNTSPPRATPAAAIVGEDAISEIAAVVAELDGDRERLHELLRDDALGTLISRLPSELTVDGPLAFDDREFARRLLARAQAVLDDAVRKGAER